MVDTAARRDNLLRAIRFDRPDYIPMTFHINGACWNHYDQATLWDLMEAHPFLFPDFARPSRPFQPCHLPNARAGAPYTDPWGCVWETPMDGFVGTVTRHPLADWDAFDGYAAPDPDKCDHIGPVDWEGPARSIVDGGEELKAAAIGHNHTWLKLADIRGYENALMDMAQDEPRLRTLLDMLERFNARLLENYVRRGVELVSFAEDLGMQEGPMLPPVFFQEYIQPSYQRLTQAASDAGCIVHIHSDGDLRQLVDGLLACPVDIINLQDLVNGVDWIANRLAGRVCIELDLDRQSVTPFGEPGDIDALVRREVETLGSRKGGLMLIYGLYPGVPLRNAEALMDAMERYAGFYS
jgi:hypothetical protein